MPAKKAARRAIIKAKKATKKVNSKIDKAAEKVAKHQPRSKVTRRASHEWAKDGSRLGAPVPQTGLHWKTQYGPEHRQRWRVLVDQVWVEITCWPDDDPATLGKARAVELYGVYAQDWRVNDTQLIEEGADEDDGDGDEADE